MVLGGRCVRAAGACDIWAHYVCTERCLLRPGSFSHFSSVLDSTLAHEMEPSTLQVGLSDSATHSRNFLMAVPNVCFHGDFKPAMLTILSFTKSFQQVL